MPIKIVSEIFWPLTNTYQVSKAKLRDGNGENLTKTDATFQDKSTKSQKIQGMCQNPKVRT